MPPLSICDAACLNEATGIVAHLDQAQLARFLRDVASVFGPEEVFFMAAAAAGGNY